MNYKLYILNSIKELTKEEKIKWIEHKMKLIEEVNLWEDNDKDIYMVLQSIKENL